MRRDYFNEMFEWSDDGLSRRKSVSATARS
jgi:hypothetical protein